MIKEINHDIQFAQKEVWGNRLLQPLSELMVLISRHQLLAELKYDKNGSVLNELKTTDSEIEEAFTLLETDAAELGNALQIDASALREVRMEKFLPSALFTQWKDLRYNMGNLTAKQLHQKHRELIINLKGLIHRIGDTSYLILEPDMDSYYIMDIVLLALPQSQERVGQILWFGEQVISQKQLTDEERLQFGVHTLMLRKSDLQRIQQDVATSLREDGNFYGISPSLQENVPPLLKHYEEATQKFIDRLEQLSQTKEVSITTEAFFEMGNHVLSTGSELWKVANKELDILLARRIDNDKNK